MSDLVESCLSVALLQPNSIFKEDDFAVLLRAFEQTLEGSAGQFGMIVDKLRSLAGKLEILSHL